MTDEYFKEAGILYIWPPVDHHWIYYKAHIDFKDKMTFYMFVPYRYLITITHNLEGWLYIFELIIDGISTENISMIFFKLIGLIYILGILMPNF